MKGRKLLCGVLAASMLTVPALAADFPDTETHWARASIDRWSDYGIIGGYDDGRFGPGDPITRAQMAVILDRLFGWTEQAENRFQDIRGDEWYAAAILRANAAGVLYGNDAGNARPNDPITRQEAAVMLARALDVEADGQGKVFTDATEIGTWAQWAVDAMSSLGLIAGTDTGAFAPHRSITRAETMVILDRAVAGYYDRAGVYRENQSGVVTIIAAPGVTLENVTIDGDLIIAPGAEGSDTILSNVTVSGKLRVLGGQEAPVLLRGETRIDSLEMAGENGQLLSEETVEIGALTVSESGVHLRGLREDQQVTVAGGAQEVLVNGHPAQAGATVTAGEDISTDGDHVVIEPGEDRPSGGTTKPNHPEEPEQPEESEQPDSPGEPEQPEQPEPQPGTGGDRDEEGNIIVDFDDLPGGA